MTWFKQVFGFNESTHAETQKRFNIESEQLLTDSDPPRRFHVGTLSIPSLDELRAQVAALSRPDGAQPTLRTVIADAYALHIWPEANGALIQVASQFNLLEMVGPGVAPKDNPKVFLTTVGGGAFGNGIQRLGPATELLTLAHSRRRGATASINELTLTTHCRRSPIGCLVGRHRQRSGRSETRCTDASVRDPYPSKPDNEKRIQCAHEVAVGLQRDSRRTRALVQAKVRLPFLDADKSTRIRIEVSTDHFLEHRLADVRLEARMLVRETLHFDLDRRWFLRNGVTFLLMWRSERVC
ncbi:hypothetical protein CBA19CS11_29220 [Caballeronia novacaledonica]|uniref:hypothetical protein n=1 Tax=Caballeronia novacaledonica TaxID=1544861 RepID=UPI001EE39385|nr:hypothetical protein [Caballeronia novacaledonica]GJH13004.1 hypothetical protein CBA19CS11_29220 [Caballeronia novacaledonica]